MTYPAGYSGSAPARPNESTSTPHTGSPVLSFDYEELVALRVAAKAAGRDASAGPAVAKLLNTELLDVQLDGTPTAHALRGSLSMPYMQMPGSVRPTPRRQLDGAFARVMAEEHVDGATEVLYLACDADSSLMFARALADLLTKANCDLADDESRSYAYRLFAARAVRAGFLLGYETCELDTLNAATNAAGQRPDDAPAIARMLHLEESNLQIGGAR